MMSSLFAAAFMLLRAAFKNRLPKRLIYALWVLVFLRFVTPAALFEFELLPPALPQNEAAESPAVTGLARIFDPDGGETAYPALPEITETDSKTPQTVLPTENKSGITPIAAVWLCGGAALLAWAVAGEAATYAKLRRGRRFMQKYRGVRVYVSESAPAGCAFGLYPAIYVAPATVGGRDFGLVLEHEYTHIRQLDHLRAPARKLLVAALWWNPLAWAYMALARGDSELACDESVAKKLDPARRLDYARLIVDSAQPTRKAVSGIGGRPMKKRINAILRSHGTGVFASVAAAALVLASLAASVCTVTRAESAVLPAPDAPAFEKAPVFPKLHDITREEAAKLLAEGDGLRWPKEYLPEWMPEGVRESVFAVERKDGVLTVTLSGGFDEERMIKENQSFAASGAPIEELNTYIAEHPEIFLPPDNEFFRKLLELPGAVWFSDDTAGMLKAAFPTGEVVKVTRINGFDSDETLEAAAKASAHGYAWSFVFYYEYHPGWYEKPADKYDGAGFEELGVVEGIPYDLLPDSFADIGEELNVAEVSVHSSGVRICVAKPYFPEVYEYILARGFVQIIDPEYRGVSSPRHEYYADDAGNAFYLYLDDAEQARVSGMIILVKKIAKTVDLAGAK